MTFLKMFQIWETTVDITRKILHVEGYDLLCIAHVGESMYMHCKYHNPH